MVKQIFCLYFFTNIQLLHTTLFCLRQVLCEKADFLLSPILR